mmetsp:Transcript_21504/g.38509  ORF Transcript_21504/g.38509 Transcript_21504/m.38509 type:complete len:119 (-) Transcript_21504:564-920(-)
MVPMLSHSFLLIEPIIIFEISPKIYGLKLFHISDFQICKSCFACRMILNEKGQANPIFYYRTRSLQLLRNGNRPHLLLLARDHLRRSHNQITILGQLRLEIRFVQMLSNRKSLIETNT